ncbi:MAG TPA: hypothetical protein VL294_11495 [Pseudolysinimonas sp.]|jgi:hypothetical protein|nr:hypothetical protein [Pseudolysinimonas sp.]
MSDAQPQRARKRTRQSADHQLVVRVKPDQQTDMRLLADALMLHAQIKRAQAEGSPVPHLAGVQKLADRQSTSEEGDDE